MSRLTVIINCLDQSHISQELLRILSLQTIYFDLHILESKTCPSRLSQLQKWKGDDFVFLDQDVVLQSADSLKQIQTHLNKMTQPCLLTGLYLSSLNFSYLQKSYNWLTNIWILLDSNTVGSMKSLQNAAGGIWAVKKSNFEYLASWQEPDQWGGEDTRTIRFLKEKGALILQHSDLDVYHMSSPKLWIFLKRAFKQGQARQKWSLKSRGQSSLLKSQHALWNSYLPAWLAHSILVILGALTEKLKSRLMT